MKMLNLRSVLQPGFGSRLLKRLYANHQKPKNANPGKPPRRRRIGLSENAQHFATQWQAEGDYYIGYDNLVKLDGMLTEFSANRSKTAKINLLSDLTLTYFAR